MRPEEVDRQIRKIRFRNESQGVYKPNYVYENMRSEMLKKKGTQLSFFKVFLTFVVILSVLIVIFTLLNGSDAVYTYRNFGQ